MKKIRNQGILFSKNKGQRTDTLYESIEEIRDNFPNIRKAELRKIRDILDLYETTGVPFFGFVEERDSTADNPKFTHVIPGELFTINDE